MRDWLAERIAPGRGPWRRLRGSLTKSALLDDGQIMQLLVDGSDSSYVEKVYDQLKSLSESYSKSLSYLVFTYALATIAIFNISDQFDISGLHIRANLIPHVALCLVTLASRRLAVDNTRLSALRSWFAAMYQAGDAYCHARLLLRYPLAYQPTQFVRSVRGFPTFVFPVRNIKWETAGSAIFLVIIILVLPIPMFIYVKAMILVWNSDLPSPLLARALVVGLIVANGAFLANPTYNELRCRYVHYGLTSSIHRLPEDKRAEAMRRIVAIQKSPTNSG